MRSVSGGFEDAAALDDALCRPNPALVDDLAAVDGDILILGAGGKMGPTLAGLARRAAPDKRVVAVARFTEPGLRERLDGQGIETVGCDLLDRAAVERLPRLENVIYMAGHKFGATGNPGLTWSMNILPAAHVAEVFAGSRIVAFSTGNVYPLVPVARGGATEDTEPGPVGEYAQSCLGRERVLQHASARWNTPGRIIRLNYAVETRYGVLHDIATRVRDGVPVELGMGQVNVIWQGDANAWVLRALRHCTTPTTPLNVSGPEAAGVRWLAQELGTRLNRAPVLAGEEAPVALLTNAGRAASLFGYPTVPLGTLLDWVADWVGRDMPSLNKPTKYEVRDGRF